VFEGLSSRGEREREREDSDVDSVDSPRGVGEVRLSAVHQEEVHKRRITLN